MQGGWVQGGCEVLPGYLMPPKFWKNKYRSSSENRSVPLKGFQLQLAIQRDKASVAGHYSRWHNRVLRENRKCSVFNKSPIGLDVFCLEQGILGVLLKDML